MSRMATFVVSFVFVSCVRSLSASEIHDAVRAGDAGRVKAAIAKDPKLVDARDDKGRTPLHMAAYYGRKDVAELLIAGGADRSAKDENGRRPIDGAVGRGHTDLLSLLVEEEVVQVALHIHRITLRWRGCPNLGISTGPDGVLLVDTGEAEVADRLKSVVHALGYGGPKYIINSHLHPPHSGGNAVMGEGATIIYYDNFEQMAAEGIISPPKSPLTGRSGRAFETYRSMHFNGEEVRLIHTPGVHTDTDLIIHFTGSGVAFMSDMLNNDSFPSCGPRIQKYLETLDTILDIFPPDTKFIPGHGHDCSMDDVRAYRAELRRTIDLIRKHMADGKTITQMRQERILKEWESWSEFLPQLGTDYWIEAVHTAYAPETP